MIFVSNKQKNERLAICEACKHYRKKTKSCGTYLLGGLVEVVGSKKKVRLCGCKMPTKAGLKWQSCPLKKWSGGISKALYKKLKETYQEIDGKQTVPKEKWQELLDMYNDSLGTNSKLGMCKPCNRAILQNLKAAFKEYEEK